MNLITKDDPDSHYPYANEEYRNLFRHALWMVPGVKEAKALSKLMKKHPVFGCGAFDIVNVAGDGDEEERSEDALHKVRHAINGAGNDGYTITPVSYTHLMETAVSPVVYTVNGKISQFILQPADAHGEPLGVFLIDIGGISAAGKGFAQGHAVDAAGENVKLKVHAGLLQSGREGKLMAGRRDGVRPGADDEGWRRPVSYTHLDVYKRQGPGNTDCRVNF